MTERIPAPPVYIWLVGDEPQVGPLHTYAEAFSRWRRGVDPRPSATVLTWEDDSDPVTWNVLVTPVPVRCSDRRVYRRRFRIAVPGSPGDVHVYVDEPDTTEGTS